MTLRRSLFLSTAVVLVSVATGSSARAQVTPPPTRNETWGAVTTVTMGAAGAIELLMPRIFYSDPEVTEGWKARWHVSQLAPVMTLTVLTLTNELLLDPAIQGSRPGCDDTNQGLPACTSYSMPSTHAFGSFAALGNGTAVWLFDMTKWSDGRFNAGSFVGNVALPLVLGATTAIGRGVGNWEDAGQILAGAGLGLVFGFLTGMTYSLMARPECGYTGNLICW
ncbi:MAG TPA: hypothetical protein VF765_02005 [Polyangiaceae bacterium]